MKSSKVGIIGAGSVGATIAYGLVLLRIGVTVLLYNRSFDRAAGEAWDIEDTIPLLSAMTVLPTDLYDDLADADVIVVTVSAPHKAGTSRLNLLGDNAEIIRSTIHELDRVAPDAIVILVSNPVDVLTQIAIETSSRSANLILGSGTALDTARLRYQLGTQFQVNPSDVNAYVVGEHGDSEFILWSSAAIGAINLADFAAIDPTKLKEMQQRFVEQTRQRGYEIGKRKGNTTYGVATVVTQLIEAILRDQKQLFTVSVPADPAYDIGDVVLGLPCIIGRQGIERKLVIPRNPDEQALLAASAAQLKQAYDSLKTAPQSS